MSEEQNDAEFIASEAELKRRSKEPLNTELHCWVQPHTMERLERYVKEQGTTESVVVNVALRALLYDQGY